MISEWELWAVAARLVERHGEAARDHALERQRDLEAEGDRGGVNAWRAILARIESLEGPPGGPLH
jgi:hypothetical protein